MCRGRDSSGSKTVLSGKTGRRKSPISLHAAGHRSGRLPETLIPAAKNWRNNLCRAEATGPILRLLRSESRTNRHEIGTRKQPHERVQLSWSERVYMNVNC